MDPIEELVAEREIRKALAQYAQYTDDLNAQGWLSMFTADGCLAVGPQRIQGQDALAAWIRNIHKGPKMRHLMTNAIIEIESPVAARVVVDMALLRAEGSRWMLVSSPRYNDTMVRTDSGWKFKERALDLRAL